MNDHIKVLQSKIYWNGSYFTKNVTEKHYKNLYSLDKFLVKQFSTHHDLHQLKYKKMIHHIHVQTDI